MKTVYYVVTRVNQGELFSFYGTLEWFDTSTYHFRTPSNVKHIVEKSNIVSMDKCIGEDCNIDVDKFYKE